LAGEVRVKRLLFVLVMAVVLGASQSGAEAHTKPPRLVYGLTLFDIALADAGNDGPTPGDILTFELDQVVPLLPPKYQRPTFFGHGFCVQQASHYATCTVVGSIGLHDSVAFTWDANESSLRNYGAITGGSGRYRDARGEVSITQIQAGDPSSIRVVLHLAN
jgi:hypothetical protein